MKRIILGISVLIMLGQSGFALSDKEFNDRIANEETEVYKQIHRCDKATMNHASTSDVNDCLKVIPLKQNSNKYTFDNKSFSITYLNIGVIYDHHGDKLNAYKYYMKSAKLGNLQAQKNLNIMCKESSWACK